VEPDLSKAELQGVARRPARGSPMNFLRDLWSLLNFQALKATVQEFQRDDAMGLAAQLAFFLILALFPFILVLVSLMGLVGNPELASKVLGYFRQVMPEEAYKLIRTYTGDVISGDRPAPYLFSFSILFTLWTPRGPSPP
jgi:membrane protein